MEEEYFKLVMSDGVSIALKSWRKLGSAPRAILLALHGMGGHGGYYSYLAGKLAPYGLVIVAPDCRGHGCSDGRRGDLVFSEALADLGCVIDNLELLYPELPIFIFGESMGACMAINFLDKRDARPLDLKGLILFSPGIKNSGRDGRMSLLTRIVGSLLYAVAPSLPVIRLVGNGQDKLQLEKYSVRYIFQLFKYARKATCVDFKWMEAPIIIFHGSEDHLISRDTVQGYFERIQSDKRKLVIVDGGSHCLMNDEVFEGYFDKLISFVISGLEPEQGI